MQKVGCARLSLLVLTLALATAACSRARERPEDILAGDATVTAAALVVANDDAVSRMTLARCARKLACAHPGAHPSADEAKRCQDEVRSELMVRLDPRGCPLGVDRTQLAECVQEIESASCEDPLGTLERYLHCRKVELCPRIAQ